MNSANRNRTRRVRSALTFTLLVAIVWIFWPRRANMREFEPDAMGLLEARMWRSYYTHSYASLARDLWLTAYAQYGFSPFDSLCLAYHAAMAANAAQPVQSRASAFAHALPDLNAYYQIIHHAAPLGASPEELARLELHWWVLRREQAGVAAYGQAISDLTGRLYAVPEATVHAAAIQRAAMMDYRDARRDGRMTEADWQHVTKGLRASYAMLRKAVQ